MSQTTGDGFLRRSERNPKKPEVFSFPPDHQPAATRIKKCRERKRIVLAVRNHRDNCQVDQSLGVGGVEGANQMGESKGTGARNEAKDGETVENVVAINKVRIPFFSTLE